MKNGKPKTESPKPVVYTKGEISKAENNLLNTQQINVILRKTPAAMIYKRPAKGGGQWNYVKGSYVKKVLNLAFGWNWDFEILDYKFDLKLGQAFVHGKLTVRVDAGNGERVITKQQFGRADIKFRTEWVTDENGKREKITTEQPLDIGNDLKAAATDATKKCASELGFFSDVYSPEEFTEMQILEDDDIVAQITELLEVDGLKITEDERLNIERILDQKEAKSYSKVLRLLNSKLPLK